MPTVGVPGGCTQISVAFALRSPRRDWRLAEHSQTYPPRTATRPWKNAVARCMAATARGTSWSSPSVSAPAAVGGSIASTSTATRALGRIAGGSRGRDRPDYTECAKKPQNQEWGCRSRRHPRHRQPRVRCAAERGAEADVNGTCAMATDTRDNSLLGGPQATDGVLPLPCPAARNRARVAWRRGTAMLVLAAIVAGGAPDPATGSEPARERAGDGTPADVTDSTSPTRMHSQTLFAITNPHVCSTPRPTPTLKKPRMKSPWLQR